MFGLRRKLLVNAVRAVIWREGHRDIADVKPGDTGSIREMDRTPGAKRPNNDELVPGGSMKIGQTLPTVSSGKGTSVVIEQGDLFHEEEKIGV